MKTYPCHYQDGALNQVGETKMIEASSPEAAYKKFLSFGKGRNLPVLVKWGIFGGATRFEEHIKGTREKKNTVTNQTSKGVNNTKGMFKSPWLRIWLVCSFLWLVGFNVWSYQRWEKMAAVNILLLDQAKERGEDVSSDDYERYLSYCGDFGSLWVIDPDNGSWIDENFGWYWWWSLGPVGVGLISVVGIEWIVVGFRTKDGEHVPD